MSKRMIIILTLFVFVMTGILTEISLAAAEDYNNYGIVIDNIKVDKHITAVNINEITYLSLSDIQKNLKMTIEGEQDGKRIKISQGKDIFYIQPPNRIEASNGKVFYMNPPVVLKNNKVYVPVLFLVDFFKYKLEVLEEIKCLRIVSADKVLTAGEVIEKYTAPPKTNKPETKAAGSKIAYLTFDDGIDRKVTPAVLDVLKRENVKGTFFVVGNTLDRNKSILKRMVEEGHSIGNHTYTHRKEIIYTSIRGFGAEIQKTSDLIYKLTGKRTRLFRPPYGMSYVSSQSYRNALKDYEVIGWNVDSMDSRSKSVKSDQITASVISQLKNKNSAIILFHDGPGHMESAKALEAIIKHLKSNGYTIAPIDENAGL